MARGISLDDKYTRRDGRIFLSGSQALVRLPLAIRRRDAARGLNTAGFISGYRGSPLGSYDFELNRARAFLDDHGVRFQGGVNEDLAATAVWGTQQAALFPGVRHDGVFALWYGKGPGVDRSGDAFKHGNMAGTSRHGGVLALAGDDHGAKSSTVAHQSEYALIAGFMPILNPATVQDILDFGVLGIEMSRFSGAWAAMKLVNETLLATQTAEAREERLAVAIPTDAEIPPGGLNIDPRFRQLDRERRLVRYRLPAAQAFVRANGLDRSLWRGERKKLGIVTAGKAFVDVIQALELLGIGEDRAAEIGLGIYKLGLVWPIEPEGIKRFSEGFEELLVVEEKRPLIEDQIARILYGGRAARPILTGKRDRTGAPLLPSDDVLDALAVAAAILRRLEDLDAAPEGAKARLEALSSHAREIGPPALARAPFFCSGCPHNTSTRVPDGSVAFSGIGCHTLAHYIPERHTLAPTQMGGEGANWIGIAPFTDTPHVFQNIGDGTYHHSGISAIRAAVAAGVNITFKILFNDAVAMTGGQPVDGEQTVPGISRQVASVGVEAIAVVADELEKYPLNAGFAAGVTLHHRDELDAVQRRLRDVKGVSVLIYDQTCAAEKRRRRKRGLLPEPDARLFINDLVCEGCGDCNIQSNCIAVEPLDTPFGRKRTINQSACNKDFSCLKGFCPSFVTVEAGRLRRPAGLGDGVEIPPCSEPARPDPKATHAVLIAGIGGTGVVTLGAILGMAAHLDGLAASVFDMTGLAQKNGAVLSHVHVAPAGSGLSAARIGEGRADLLLGCDLVVAAAPDARAAMAEGRSRAVLNAHVAPTAAFQRDFDIDFSASRLTAGIEAGIGPERVESIDATRYAARLFGDDATANIFLAGFAFQKGLLPVSSGAFEDAIQLNGARVEANLKAFRVGRFAAHDFAAFKAAFGEADAPAKRDETLDETIARRTQFLVQYQDEDYAARYGQLVRGAIEAESRLAPGYRGFAEAVARSLFKLMAYKDEYEVARLYADPAFKAKIAVQFEGAYRLSVHLAPPLFAEIDPESRLPVKKPYGGWVFSAFKLLARMKRLRGTWFDPLGRTQERRAERALIVEYEADIGMLTEALSPETHAVAVELASLPQGIRGFGPIKARSMDAAAKRRAELLRALSEQPNAAGRAA